MAGRQITEKLLKRLKIKLGLNLVTCLCALLKLKITKNCYYNSLSQLASFIKFRSIKILACHLISYLFKLVGGFPAMA